MTINSLLGVTLTYAVVVVLCCAAKELNYDDIARNRTSVMNEEFPKQNTETALTAQSGVAGGGVGVAGGGVGVALAATATSATATAPSSSSSMTGPEFQISENCNDILATSVLTFAHNMAKELLSQRASHINGNQIFSPISIMSALAMLMLGAKGRSYIQLQSIFGGLDQNVLELFNKSQRNFHTEFGHLLEDLQKSASASDDRRTEGTEGTHANATNNSVKKEAGKSMREIIKVANGLFVQAGYKLNRDYLYASENIYHSTVVPLDFARKFVEARNYINHWIDESTYGRISRIIGDEIARDTNVIIANSLYFKGFWENQFFEIVTSTDNFYPNGLQEPPIKVQMMATGGEFPFYNSPEYDCRIIGLPYRGNQTTMYIIQPNHSTRSKLREFQHGLDATKIANLFAKMTKKTVILALPKMHFDQSINLKYILNNLGVRDIFLNGISDLSLIGSAFDGVENALLLDNDQSELKDLVDQNLNQSFTTTIVPVQATTGAVHSSLPDRSSPPFPQGLPLSPVPANQMQKSLTKYVPKDRFNEPALIFQRFGLTDDDNDSNNNDDQYQSINTSNPNTPPINIRSTRQTAQAAQEQQLQSDISKINLENLEKNRFNTASIFGKSNLFIQDIVHKVNIEVNEQGTEAAAATLTYLRRSGTDVLFRADTPFLFLIRHDPTKLILFYGIINEP